MEFFAEQFDTVGKYEGFVYPEIPGVLGRIKRLGYRTYLATAKPQHIARQILEHFALDKYFDGAYGSVHDKAALIADILKADSLIDLK